jgi:glyoxylase-like metal-dependent hydrolase (beta-lactamase superfamily II)
MIHAIINLFTENTYIINEGNEAFIIDPGADLKQIESYIDQNNFDVKAVLLTHGHFDHILYLNEVVDRYKCPVYLHQNARNFLFDPTLNLSSTIDRKIVFKHKEYVKTFTTPFEITLKNERIKVTHTPGHTRGCVSYYYGSVLFTGDVLFRGTIGRTDLPTSNENEMLETLTMLATSFHDNTLIYPGHGEFTTLIQEKRGNRFLRKLS